ncbi:MAG: ABC transporter ATP-binding protein [Candidatus Gracilibacteria bacterium]|nr:ABC transporter ATP-binding protein [Candidatus Gracilibacteria bacterium]
MNKTIKNIYISYLKTVGKSKFIFILFFGMFVSFIVILEPIIFTQIIKKIEYFYQTGIFDKTGTINQIILRSVFIVFSISMQFIYDYVFVGHTTNKNYVEECNKYTKKIISMNYSDYLLKKQGGLYKILDRGTDSQVKFLYFFFQDILRSSIGIIFIIIILIYINPLMSLIVLGMVPVMCYLGYFFIKKVSPHQKDLNDRWDAIFATIGNLLSGFMLTKVLTLENTFTKDIQKRLGKILDKQLEINKYWSISTIYTNVVVMISRILVLGFGVFFVINNKLSFAELFLFFNYIGWIYFPLGYIFSRFREATQYIVGVEKMHTEFDLLESEDIHTGSKIKKVDGKIEYNNIRFKYTGKKTIFKDLSFEINPGEKVAFVGNTGAGKSTIVNLLLRFWDTTGGEILLDGKNINTISKKELRKHIGIVTQEVSLFNDSIKNNLLFVNPKASDADLKNCLKMAEANFVFDFDEGIDTIIGERGLKLSGGEKQRLSIARLFLKNPEILILDEATSALDNKTEKLIQKALDKLMKGRTSIVIAHRLSTIQNSDNIFVLENGKIVESGNYTKLINQKAKFYELSNPQHLIIN